jgi:NET1-associated nuclear protein 1 (U3 small nucleolar RNA-associated protein 17)
LATPSASSKGPPETETLFTTFTPVSKDPVNNKRVPFALRQCILWEDDLIDNSEPSYVGIIPGGELIHIGDQVPNYSKDDRESRPLDGVNAGEPGQPTLFQDLFGKSAILDYDTTVDKNSHKSRVGTDTQANLSSKDDFDWSLLEGPSHLLPSIQTLFNPLMESMFRTNVRAKPENVQKDLDNDVEMATIVPEERSAGDKGRRVSEEEMNTLIDLFREPTFTSKSENHSFLMTAD